MMTMVEEDPPRQLRAGFDLAAEDYQRTRPVCPARLFDDLMLAGGLTAGDRVAEIGCGTGQASVPLAERGLAVTAVELGPALAAIARRRLAEFPAAEVVTGSFEDWQPARAGFDAVVAVSSLHWIDPAPRYAKPHALLRPGGILAVAGCQWARPAGAHRFWTEVQEDYRAVGYAGEPPPPPEQIGPRPWPPEANGLFEEVAGLRYPFELGYRPEDYLAILASQSGTRALGQARSADFLARVRRRLRALGWPELTATFVACLTVGRRSGLLRAPTQGAGQRQAGEEGADQGAEADAQVDRYPALLGPVDVLEVEQQRELVDDEGQAGAVGQGHRRVAAPLLLAVHGHAADPGDQPDAPHVVVQVLAADAHVAERALAVLDGMGNAPDRAERGGEGQPAEQGGPLGRIQVLTEDGTDVLAERRCDGHC
jgi:SAM-dependent methyltransferase